MLLLCNWVFYFKSLQVTCAIFAFTLICGNFFLWLFVSSVPNWIIANLVNLCFNV